ncbi:DUF3251 domain-containing protein [Myxococcus sp. K38C18041901]|uniref:DUF3251 domain-containing protein n=1 Tax=Myxococcus guangdongensis TaxID=2906760 RepID=UPI0020A6E050|nr:DUF3251 domain-containing protein [Myxococcus guangdongensis]MCP3059259.1 DUF3251 domain-containing protein [Myxococcus guangdongensis]
MDNTHTGKSTPISDTIGCITVLAVVLGIGYFAFLGAKSAWASHTAKKGPTPEEIQAKKDLDLLRSRIDMLEAAHTQMQAEMRFAASAAESAKTASFTPGSAGYQLVQSKTGTFLVRLDKVAPYANGQRLTFQVANTQSITYKNPTITVTWSTAAPEVTESEDYAKAYETWTASRRTKTETVFIELQPGWWSTFNIVVSPATASEVANIDLALTATIVSIPIR